MGERVVLTPVEADRAIYIDFEGTKTDPPSLLGAVFSPGRGRVDQTRLVYQVDIIEPALASAVDADLQRCPVLPQVRARSLVSVIGELVGRAEKQKRLLVSWSEREIDAVRAGGLPAELVERFDRCWVNAIPMARRWRRLAHPEVEFAWSADGGANKLSRYLDLIGYPCDPAGRSVSPAEAIRRVRGGLAHKGTFAALVTTQQQQWVDLIAHNYDDCAGMRAVVRAAAQRLTAE